MAWADAEPGRGTLTGLPCQGPLVRLLIRSLIPFLVQGIQGALNEGTLPGLRQAPSFSSEAGNGTWMT